MKLYQILLALSVVIACSPKQRIQYIKTSPYNVNEKTQTVVSDPEIDSYLKPYQERIQQELSIIIGECKFALAKDQPEGTLGNWFADALLEETQLQLNKQIDFTFQNSGGLRVSGLPSGPITKQMIFELMPFDNLVVLLSLNKEQVMRLFDKIASHGGAPVSKSVKLVIRDKKVLEAYINTEPLKDRLYTVLLSDYIANGGDDYEFLKSVPRIETGLLIRNIIEQHIKRNHKDGKMIEATLDGRIQIKK